MTNLSHLELENIRHLVGSHETVAQKLCSYADQCTDPQIKQMFHQSSEDAKNTKQKLISFLG
ncbi:MAG: hypothetical protein GX238_06285 [Epulopiscium sp.]|nr:hypothetical protein [Candidatus Epulonipiscium sp.]